MRRDDKAAALVRDTFGDGEHVVAVLSATPPSAIGAAAVGGVLGGAVGAVALRTIGSAISRRSKGEETERHTDEAVAVSIDNLNVGGSSRLVLTSYRLAAWNKGRELVCNLPLSAVTGVATESSGLSPGNLVVEIAAGGSTARLEGTRRQVKGFADSIADLIGQAVIARDKEQPSFWLLRAFAVGVLYFFGAAMLLLAIPTAEDKSIAYAAVMAVIGLALLVIGEFARRRLLRRK